MKFFQDFFYQNSDTGEKEMRASNDISMKFNDFIEAKIIKWFLVETAF